MFGLDLPALPGSYLTLQVTCVSCQEPFAVSEGRVVTVTRDDGQRVRRRNWRLALDQIFTIGLRYEQNRYRQEVRTASRADPNFPHHGHEANGVDNYINCPRCGADNRNWLEIIAPRQHTARSFFDLLMPPPFSQWKQRFPSAYLSILIAIFLGITTLLLSATEAISLAQALWIFAAAVLTAGGTADDLTRTWPQIRMQKHLEQILRRRRAGLNSPALRGIILTILFALIFPLLAFRVGPRTMALGSRVVRPANPNNRAITGDRRQPAELSDDFYNTFNAEVEPFLHDISRMNAGNVQDLQFLIAKLDRLHTVITEEEKTYRDRLVAYFDEPPRTPAQVQDEAEDEEIKGIRDNLLFLALWFVIVGAANTAATFLSIVAVNRYVRFIDRQLPPPIFSSVANMSRVVAWEAKRALQIDGDMGHVQWMEVRRNEVGGINLIGLHRSVPEVDSENKPVSQWVRAQRYFISTDMWGRIRDTIIRDMRVPRTVVPPGQQQMGQEAGRGNPPFIPLQRPPTPPGNDLAEDFFSRPTTPPKTPDRTVMVEAVAPKAKNGSSDDTAVQPPIRLLTPPPTKSETTDEKRDRLCEELARILEGVFTEHELQQLYATLNLDYTRFAGTRLEKCQDLINFYRRRQRLTELVRACVDMHPFVLWGDIFDLYDE